MLQTDADLRGAEPLLAEGPHLEIADRTYRFTRLGLEHVFEVANLIKGVVAWGVQDSAFRFGDLLVTGKLKDTDVLMLAPLMGLPMVKDGIFKLLSMTLQREWEDDSGAKVWAFVDPAHLKDPSLFPASSLIDLIVGLSNHPDLKSFFSSGTRLRESPIAARALDMAAEAWKVAKAKTEGVPETPTPESPTAGS